MQKIHGKKRNVKNKCNTHGVWVGEVSSIGQPAAEVVVCASPAGQHKHKGHCGSCQGQCHTFSQIWRSQKDSEQQRVKSRIS